MNFQFRLDRDGRPRPFEINARFSGTTPLRALAGFNEVEMALRHVLLGEPVVQPGTCGRWMLPSDISWASVPPALEEPMSAPDARPLPAPGPLGRLAARLVSERVVVSAIVLNGLALLVMASTDDQSALESVAHKVDILCVAFFVLEAALKIGLHGPRGYFANGWNRVDFVLVLLSSPALLAAGDYQEFAVVLVLRLGRLFRLFRLLRFIPNRDHLFAGVRRAMRAAVGVLLALVLLNFILAVGATFLFGRLVPEHFGNPALSAYTMFRVFTIEGWPDLPALVASRAAHPIWGVIARLYFAGSVLVGGIMGLSLANAVFVDEMTTDNTSALEAKVDALHAEIVALRQALGVKAPTATSTPPAPAAPALAPGDPEAGPASGSPQPG